MATEPEWKPVVGMMVCTCRMTHVRIVSVADDGDTIVTEDDWRCSFIHCCDPVDHDWSHDERTPGGRTMMYDDAVKLVLSYYSGAGLTESELIDRYNALHADWPQLAQALDELVDTMEGRDPGQKPG